MADFSQQQHEMCLEKTHQTGAEEWHCPTCGRRFVMQWPPRYKRIILTAGDEYASHSGGKGGLKMGEVQTQSGEGCEPLEDDLPLEHWKEWLNSEDADKWWPDG